MTFKLEVGKLYRLKMTDHFRDDKNYLTYIEENSVMLCVKKYTEQDMAEDGWTRSKILLFLYGNKLFQIKYLPLSARDKDIKEQILFEELTS